MLEASRIRVAFGGVVALHDVGIGVGDAEVVGLVGPNGSGKSTLLNAVTGFVPAEGDLVVDGRPVPLGDVGTVRSHGLLRTFQTPKNFPTLTCLENVLVSTANRRSSGVPAVLTRRRRAWREERQRWAVGREALTLVGLAGRADDLAGELPYGQLRVLELARACAGRPRMILLDEPAAGLNESETKNLLRILQNVRHDGIALLVVDHKIDFISGLCDRVVVLATGRVVAEGDAQAVWHDPRVIEAYVGRPWSVEA